MLKEEFEDLIGKKVDDADFEKWESLYMESDLDKYEFCKLVKKAVKAKEEVKNYAFLEIYKFGKEHYLRGIWTINIATGKNEMREVEDFEREPYYDEKVFKNWDIESGDLILVNYK